MTGKGLTLEAQQKYLPVLAKLERQLTGIPPPEQVDDGVVGDGVDAAVLSFQSDMSMLLEGNRQRTLRRVQDAQQRIRNGVFGICEGCDEPIATSRLHAIPFVENCIDCQRKDELHVRSYQGRRPTDDEWFGNRS